MAAVLTGGGAHVLQAADGEQALELRHIAAAAGRQLDAVLLDVRSSSVDGWVTIRRLRAAPGGTRSELPVFVLSDSDTAYSRQLAELFGATGLLQTPCTSGSLFVELDEAITRARAERFSRLLAEHPLWSRWAQSEAA